MRGWRLWPRAHSHARAGLEALVAAMTPPSTRWRCTPKAAARSKTRRASACRIGRERGLTEPALEAIEDAARDAFNLRAAVHPLVIGPRSAKACSSCRPTSPLANAAIC
ncbi:MAG: hypothetical protein R3C16_08745 [Hyphomonadaceae bacterium]